MLSLVHTMIGSCELEGTLKGQLVPLPCSDQGYPHLHQVLRAWSSMTLNISKDVASTAPLGKPVPVSHCPKGLSWCFLVLRFSTNATTQVRPSREDLFGEAPSDPQCAVY